MAKPKAKPHDPSKALAERARDFHAVGLAVSAAMLSANEDIEVQRLDTRDAVKRARRLDAFDALKTEMNASCPGSYDAIRRLERDITTQRGEHDRGRPLEASQRGADGKSRVDRMVDAGRRVAAVYRLLRGRDCLLLAQLIRPSRETVSWRETVQHITGEKHAMAQGAAVRAACANLKDAYDTLDRVSRKGG